MRSLFCRQVFLYSLACSALGTLVQFLFGAITGQSGSGTGVGIFSRLQWVAFTLAWLLLSWGWLAGVLIQRRFHRHERPLYFNAGHTLVTLRLLSWLVCVAVGLGLLGLSVLLGYPRV